MEVKLRLEAEGERLECDVCGKMLLQNDVAYVTTAEELEEVTKIRCKVCFEADKKSCLSKG